MLCYYCNVLKNLSKLVFSGIVLAEGGGQKSKISPRAPTEPGYAYFRPPAKWLPLSLKSLSDCLCHERDGVEDSNAEDRSFNNKVKQNKEQKPPRRGKTSRQAGRRLGHSQTWNTHVTHDTWKTTDQPRIADIRRLYRETNEGNEGDTAGATETMIK